MICADSWEQNVYDSYLYTTVPTNPHTPHIFYRFCKLQTLLLPISFEASGSSFDQTPPIQMCVAILKLMNAKMRWWDQIFCENGSFLAQSVLALWNPASSSNSGGSDGSNSSSRVLISMSFTDQYNKL